MGAPFPQLVKLTALHCRALNDALPVHLKQEHFCEGFVPKHAFVDLRSFRPSVGCGHGDHSLTDRKASQNQFPSASRKLIFLGIGELLAANTPATHVARPRDDGSAKSSKFHCSLYVLCDTTATGWVVIASIWLVRPRSSRLSAGKTINLRPPSAALTMLAARCRASPRSGAASFLVVVRGGSARISEMLCGRDGTAARP